MAINAATGEDSRQKKKKHGGTVNTQVMDPNVGTQTQSATNTQGTTIGRAERDDAAQIDTTKQAEFRQKQMDFANQLQQQMSGGGGPSIAQLQFQKNADSNIANQMAIARSGGGPLAMRQAMMNTASLNQQAANQSAQIREQEMMDAQNQLANVLNQGRTSDINLAENQAGLNEQATLANQSATNNRNIVQGQLNTSIQNTNTSASATVRAAQATASGMTGAASIAANASKYGVDAANYRFNEGAMLGLDQGANSAAMAAAGGNYSADMQANAANANQAQNFGNFVTGVGTGIASYASGQPGKGGGK